MNAIQFIKEHGIDKAREVIDGAPYLNSDETHFCSDVLYYTDGWNAEGECPHCVGISVLKSLVLRLDLIDRLGGINKASELFVKYQHLGESCFQEYLQCSSRSLEQAIADYETIYGGEHV